MLGGMFPCCAPGAEGLEGGDVQVIVVGCRHAEEHFVFVDGSGLPGKVGILQRPEVDVTCGQPSGDEEVVHHIELSDYGHGGLIQYAALQHRQDDLLHSWADDERFVGVGLTKFGQRCKSAFVGYSVAGSTYDGRDCLAKGFSC